MATSAAAAAAPARATSGIPAELTLSLCQKLRTQGSCTHHELMQETAAAAAAAATPEAAAAATSARRRVHDVLSMLSAAGVVRKEAKQVAWLGIPGADFVAGSTSVATRVQQGLDAGACRERLARKKEQLEGLQASNRRVAELIARNAAARMHSATSPPASERIQTPFLLLQTSDNHEVQSTGAVTATGALVEVTYSLHEPFSLMDSNELLQQILLNVAEPQEAEAKRQKTEETPAVGAE